MFETRCKDWKNLNFEKTKRTLRKTRFWRFVVKLDRNPHIWSVQSKKQKQKNPEQPLNNSQKRFCENENGDLWMIVRS